uniref:Sulfotransferase 1C4-like n=1 Tax=Saccoglossus kowalevskii TaxID=10224 RepID=A0ABM0GZK3_SACKO|nr:PREDICTED: sulfotransferase 1C4-like [Saccoglossus kowalevskii]
MDDKVIVPGTIEYQGAAFQDIVNIKILDSPDIVNCRDDDVFVVSYPKAGTTWAIEIVSLIMNGGDVDANHAVPQPERNPMLESYISRPMLTLMYIMKKIQWLLPSFLHLENYIFVPPIKGLFAFDGMRQMEKLPSPRLIKSHLPYKFFSFTST